MHKIIPHTILAAGLLTSLTLTGQTDPELEKRAKEIHQKALTVDTHCDTPMNMLEEDFDVGGGF